MIAKSITGQGATGLVRYVLGEGNENNGSRRRVGPNGPRSRILGSANFGLEVNTPERLELFRRFIEWSAQPENQHSRTKKCTNDVLHLSLNYAPGEKRTDHEMMADAREALAALGMTEATAAYIRHNDSKTHEHLHIIASRLHPTTGRTFDNTDERLKLTAWTLDWERRNDRIPEAKRELHQTADAVRSRKAKDILERITDKDATFTRKQLEKTLALDSTLANDRNARRQLAHDMLENRDVVMLRGHDQTRFTTNTVLRHEARVMDASRKLAKSNEHSVWGSRVSRHEQGLNSEQRRALWSATDERGISLIAGQAGTGKTRTLQAIRDAYVEQGHQVLGLAHTNQVVNDMRDAGFNASTLAAEQTRTKRQPWAPKQVLLVDESAMLSTRSLDWVIGEANKRHAKVVLVGDDRQLGSIERGGLFTRLAAEHGASELQEVQRVKEPELKRAFNQMHARDFGSALETFERRGGIHWHDKLGQAEEAMARKYRDDVAADPKKTRMMYAATNEAVERLNHLAREHRKTLGELRNEQTVQTPTGPRAFAVGDQVQFTKSGPTATHKRAGWVNGAVGQITKLDRKGRATVDLGTKRNGKPRTLEIDSLDGVQHGYASTVFRTQGQTLDQTYALHTPHWREATSYVAMTRSRGDAELFVAREHAADLDELAHSMGREQRKVAASSLGRIPPERAAYLRQRAAEQVRDEAATYARRQAERLNEPPREDWRAAERRADALNRKGAERPAPPEATPRPHHAPHSEQGEPARKAAPGGGEPVRKAPQAQAKPNRSVGEPDALTAKAPPNQALRRDAERSASTEQNRSPRLHTPRITDISIPPYPPSASDRKEPTQTLAKSHRADSFPQEPLRHADAAYGGITRKTSPNFTTTAPHGRELRGQDGAPLGGAAHPQGPVERNRQREAMQGKGTERPQPRREAPKEPPRTQEPERPWALEAFKRAAEASNERRRAELFTGQPHSDPEIRLDKPSSPPHAQQPQERKRAVRDRFDALTAALSGIRDRTRDAVSDWWQHRGRSEERAHALSGGRGRESRNPDGFERAQGHWPPRTDPSPRRQASPAADPIRERPQAAPQSAPQPRTEPPRAAPTPPRQESREAPAKDMRPQIKEALDRTFSQEPSRGRSRDGPQR